jgi:hypothetical protein
MSITKTTAQKILVYAANKYATKNGIIVGEFHSFAATTPDQPKQLYLVIGGDTVEFPAADCFLTFAEAKAFAVKSVQPKAQKVIDRASKAQKLVADPESIFGPIVVAGDMPADMPAKAESKIVEKNKIAVAVAV